ncbi:MAG: pilus assembly PilX N-terminal domain-containing protein [Thermodesulfobacteriota bacterium]
MKAIRENKKNMPGFSVSGLLGDESGVVLAIALMVMGIMAVTGAAIISTSTTDVKVAGNVTRSMQALNTAEAGMSDAINAIRADPGWGPDLDKDGELVDDATEWAAQTQANIAMGSVNGAYTVEVYDSTGTNGRSVNSTRSDKYTTLGGDDVLVEVTGTVSGVTRKVGLVVRNSITAFDYATYSNGSIEGDGIGANPGKLTGKIYGHDSINLQGNFDLGAAKAQSTSMITPNCSSGKFQTCDDAAATVSPPILDFAFYQDQANFSDQQVFMMTPTVGSTSSCGGNCTEWPINYAITTMGTSYTVQATVQAVQTGPHNYNHTVHWCTDPNWNGVIGSCSGTANTYTFSSDDPESEKPFVDAYQFNHYSNPTGAGYGSSVVNVIDAQGHLEFLGPTDPAASVDITASILVGTAANNSQPEGKIDFEGGAGTMNFKPANGLAVVGEKVEFKAKYSSINVNVGTASNGAVIIATKEMEVEAENEGGASTQATFNMNGSLLVGNDTVEPGELDIGGDGNTSANFTYTPIMSLPMGWQNYGTMSIERREWRELS